MMRKCLNYILIALICSSCSHGISSTNSYPKNMQPIYIDKPQNITERKLIKTIKDYLVAYNVNVTDEKNNAKTRITIKNITKSNIKSTNVTLASDASLFYNSEYLTEVCISFPGDKAIVAINRKISDSIPIIILENQNIFSGKESQHIHEELAENVANEVLRSLFYKFRTSKE